MEYKVESSLMNFKAWAGAHETLSKLVERGLVEDVEYLIEEIFTEIPTETENNDFLWFETDMIAEHLGYQNWETFLKETEK